ncbi:MAG: YfbK domain-containing protein, partial [Anaerohalosphaeraceae bacterium]
MKKHNEQFENNISRLLKTSRESNRPSEEFTQNLVDDALNELKTDQDRRQRRRKTVKYRFPHELKFVATFIICGGLVSLICALILIGDNVQSKFEMLESSTEGPVATQEQPPVLDLRGKSVQVAVRNPSDNKPFSADSAKGEHIAVLDISKIGASRYPGRQTSGKISSVAKSDNMEVQVIRGSKAHDEEVIAGRRMAHGGTRPPNGEDVDAMFFENYGVNPFIDTEDDHLSTFAIDVDTGSYTVCRRYLQQGNLPPKEAVRVEEFVNYFKYDYDPPQEETFAVYTEAMPWSFGAERKNTHLMRIGLKAMEVADESRNPAVLTFVIDVSGSMNRENRLGLVKRSLEMLIDKLRPQDKIGIAVYGSRGMKVLDHTGLEDKAAILAAIRSLHSTGSTYAEDGIRIGYEMAEEAYIPGFINRVILCSDGVANVGNTGADKILEIIKDKADKGITLSSLGFGMGNYNDVLLERLGDKGNGYYAYIDTIDQARRLFSNLTGALQVVARDVKIQVDFNPDVVRSYRLIGYENRDVADKDFRNDTVDGGEIGAGHSTTALYELKLWPEKVGKVATTQIRYKNPDTYEVTEIA